MHTVDQRHDPLAWARDHPHFHMRRNPRNVVYVSSPTLKLPGLRSTTPGAGRSTACLSTCGLPPRTRTDQATGTSLDGLRHETVARLSRTTGERTAGVGRETECVFVPSGEARSSFWIRRSTPNVAAG